MVLQTNYCCFWIPNLTVEFHSFDTMSVDPELGSGKQSDFETPQFIIGDPPPIYSQSRRTKSVASTTPFLSDCSDG